MKFAYLIIAHNNFNLLRKLILMLVHPDNDIYVHIDAKVDREAISDLLGSDLIEKINLIDPISVTWGGYSQVECEMKLFKAAINADKGYDYLHLISGVDLPIKSQEYIHTFFEENQGKEFIYFDKDNNNEIGKERCRYFHFFQEYFGRASQGFLPSLERKLLKLQEILHVNRGKSIEEFAGKGANWVSITGKFATFLVENEKQIERYFKYSRCCDEVFLHTFFNMSPFCDNRYIPHDNNSCDEIFYSNMVCTDWKRGKPYTFKDEDLSDLVASPYLFARKFDENISIDLLEELIK